MTPSMHLNAVVLSFSGHPDSDYFRRSAQCTPMISPGFGGRMRLGGRYPSSCKTNFRSGHSARVLRLIRREMMDNLLLGKGR